jgi:hypothetical protein
VRQGTDQRHPRVPGGSGSQAPTMCRPPLLKLATMQDEIRLKNRLWRQCQVTRGRALNAERNHLQRSVTCRLNEWKNEQSSDELESLGVEDLSLWKVPKRVMRVPTPSFLLQVPARLAILDSEKAEALAESLEAQFQLVDDPWAPVLFAMANEAMCAYD